MSKEKAYTYPLRLPRSLQKRLKERADKEGVSLNQYIVFVLSMAVGGQIEDG